MDCLKSNRTIPVSYPCTIPILTFIRKMIRYLQSKRKWQKCLLLSDKRKQEGNDLIPLFYGSVFAASLLCSAIYVYIWHKHFDVNFAMIFAFVPVSCMGYLIYSLSENMRDAVIGIKLTYVGGCFLQFFFLFSILNLCQVEIRNWLRLLLFSLCVVLFASVLTIGYMDLFYQNISFSMVDRVSVLERDYGWMHTVFYAVVILFFTVGIVTICHSCLKKKQVPRTILYLIVIPDVICMLSFFVGRRLYSRIDVVPLGYVLAQILYIIIANRMTLYDVADTVIDSMVQERQLGYVSFDFRNRYLGSNETARLLMPELEFLAVDDVLGDQPFEKKLRHFLDSFRKDPERKVFLHVLHSKDGNEENDRFFNVNVNYLYDGSRKKGYLITFTDDTANRKYVRLLDTYNEKLQSEVEQKTRHIIVMHDNLIMSLAMMVESRDNSTGGHIKRTSVGVRILIDEIRKEGKIGLSEEFCRDVVKAAPMHDLGKIAVDDAVLRKPGRFTAEEYEKMKQHAPEGARVIHQILLQTDDDSFKIVAENVAHYHHEWWDGSGYPQGLSGEEIPMEARIMAIADVYDALVSKRVYKEAFDFEKANSIILDGMGTQFDPGLKSIYEKARPRLESYYKELSAHAS